jgi:histidinol phosphatase-like enzyme
LKTEGNNSTNEITQHEEKIKTLLKTIEDLQRENEQITTLKNQIEEKYKQVLEDNDRLIELAKSSEPQIKTLTNQMNRFIEETKHKEQIQQEQFDKQIQEFKAGEFCSQIEEGRETEEKISHFDNI